ncbi:autotransporter assembly complex protein TamA [Microvirga flavescens]|uniref:autotransporter assembly complex protein TamA n=1 Tax=Microvirga flavescens TaxID=2249811 RepID=UPI000DD8143F|nr:autotransporter assembly complex family protein [Microvirga flavescens]
MRLLPRRDPVSLSARILACLLLFAGSEAKAFDFFGLFGTKEQSPAPSQTALPYSLIFEIEGGGRALTSLLQEASSLYRLRDDAPVDGDSLARRGQADLAPLLDALWGAGFYNATVEIDVAGARLAFNGSPAAAASAAERYRGASVVPVKVRAVPGPLFSLRRIEVIDAGTMRLFSPEELPPQAIGIKPRDPARSADLKAAEASILDHFRTTSHPLVKTVALQPVVNHATQTMDVTYVIAPGPIAPFGEIGVSGTQNVPASVVRSFVYVEPGDPYSPKAIADTRKSVATIPALGSVRIREADRLDSQGRLPIFVETTERKPRLVGLSANYSTIDGPALRAYWEHRNLFGGAERLRLESDLLLLPRNDGTRIKRIEDLDWSDLGGRFRASFLKPALYGSRNDLLIDGLIERTRTGGDRFGGYTSRLADGTAVIRHRFSEAFSVQAGLQLQKGQTSDVLGEVDYFLVGTPASLTYDSTDRPLDPTRGWRITASLAPYPAFLGSTVNMFVAKGTASTYYALDDEARYILAGRIGLGSIAGPSLDEIPANWRFFAGGGGSVRGYRYQSLGPMGPFGFVVGGRSLFEASLEARIKITDTIGIVPFIDAGNAFDAVAPSFNDKLFVSAGLGLRYYTPIGPIRLDVATPLNRREGDKPVAIYVSIGQSF